MNFIISSYIHVETRSMRLESLMNEKLFGKILNAMLSLTLDL